MVLRWDPKGLLRSRLFYIPTFPGIMEGPVIEELLDDVVQSADSHSQSTRSKTMSMNINTAKQRILESGGNLDQPYVVDCDASKQKSCYMKNISNDLTKSRNKGHWLLHWNTRMSIKEMMRLQGV